MFRGTTKAGEYHVKNFTERTFSRIFYFWQSVIYDNFLFGYEQKRGRRGTRGTFQLLTFFSRQLDNWFGKYEEISMDKKTANESFNEVKRDMSSWLLTTMPCQDVNTIMMLKLRNIDELLHIFLVFQQRCQWNEIPQHSFCRIEPSDPNANPNDLF